MTARDTAFGAYLAARGQARSLDERLLDAMAAVAVARLAPAGLATVARDVAALSGLEGDERRALSIIVLATSLVTREGSTRLPLPGSALATVTTEVLSRVGDGGGGVGRALEAPGELVSRAVGVVGSPTSERPLLWLGDALAPARLHRAEEEIARALQRRAPRPASTADAFADVAARPTRAPDGAPTTLTEEQASAVRAGCERGLTIVTGGPGTGKTSVLVALLRTLVRCGVQPSAIALAAPTGKAAERMTEATARALASLEAPSAEDEALIARLPRASTLHRLLGYSPSRRAFMRGADDPLPHEVVIVDEASMVDVELGRALANALPDAARLVLLGDPEQLPSVGAGTLLSDLARARPEDVSHLTQSHRMRASDPAGSAVLALSRQIALGVVDRAHVATRSNAGDLAWSGVEHVDGSALDGVLARLAERHIAEIAAPLRRVLPLIDGQLGHDDAATLVRALANVSRVRVLSPLRGGALGTEALSDGIAWRAARALPRTDDGPPAGTPVLVTANDYARGLFNGDQGLIVRVRRRGITSLEVAFVGDGGVALHPWDAIAERATPTFALTVHKSQGSECDVVVLALADAPSELASRALLYTAVTRARRGVVLVGELDALVRMAATSPPRASGLRALLARH